MFPSLRIVIINLDLKLDTESCIRSLIVAGAAIDQIIVVDNGSKDGSVMYLNEKFGSKLEIAELNVNRGYPHGLNVGIKCSLKHPTEWVLLMNNDTIVAPDFLVKLHEATQIDKTVALIGPMILYYSEPDTIWFMRALRVDGTMIYTNPDRGKSAVLPYPVLMETDFVHGCTMLIRKDVFEKIGMFDDSSVIYGDDLDFSYRAQAAGFKLAAAPKAKMWHKISAFMQKHKPQTRYLRIRNQIRIYRRYSRNFQLIFMFLFSSIRVLVIFMKDVWLRQFELISPLLWGWWHGWSGKGEKNFK